MCGIAGIWHMDGRPVSETDLASMGESLVHRGPDDDGQWRNGPVGLIHRRLSILDLSAAGHQPMSSDDGRYIITYNGEIYNHQALRQELERTTGYRFRSTCDTEVLPIGFATWGVELFDKLEGMFALAVWDCKEQRLTVARDGVGIKPLYLLRQGSTLYFASEIKAFMAVNAVPKELSPHSIHELLANGYVSPDSSILKNAWQLKPGSYLQIDTHTEQEVQYWKPKRRADIHNLNDASEAVEETLRTVVGDMMHSDVRIGILQSGGIDSSLISYAAKGQDVPLFTAQFKQKSFDETDQARLVANDTGMAHHIVPMNDQMSALDTVKTLARAYEGQLSDSSGFAFSTLCHTIKQHVTVALAGEGGDEFFAGYPTYRASRLGQKVRKFLPSRVWRSLGRSALQHAARTDTRIPPAEKFGRFALGMAENAQSMHAQWRRYLFTHQQNDLFGHGLRDVATIDPMFNPMFNPMDGYTRALQTAEGSTVLDRWMVGDQSYYLPGDMLAKTDRISMAHSLEIRVPFLDRRMMELAGRIDASLMTSWVGADKKVLRHTLKRMGGPEDVVRFAKKGFNVPISIMLREELSATCETMFGKDADRFAPFLSPDGVRKLWREHRDMVASHHYVLWTLLILGIWMDETGIR